MTRRDTMILPFYLLALASGHGLCDIDSLESRKNRKKIDSVVMTKIY